VQIVVPWIPVVGPAISGGLAWGISYADIHREHLLKWAHANQAILTDRARLALKTYDDAYEAERQAYQQLNKHLLDFVEKSKRAAA